MLNDEQSIRNWKLAKELFEKYLDDPSETSLIKIKSNTDISSEVKEIVEQLIQSQPEGDTTLDSVNTDFISSINLDEDYSGESVGDYLLKEKIGRGGMSQVYKAQRIIADIQKPVALKLLKRTHESLTETQKHLFESEQMALSRLSHPNIVSFHHGGVSDSGWMYLAMEFENALTINEFCAVNKLNTRHVVDLMLQVSEALVYSHSKLIIHKDIKPANILVNDQGVAKLVDFGIASIQGENKGDSLKLYTPDYASLEQVKNSDIGMATDVFSLSAVLYEILAGQRFMEGIDFKVINEAEYNEIKSNKLKKLNIIKGQKDICLILSKGMSYYSTNRYDSMREFANDLRNWQLHLPVSVRKGGGFYKFIKLIQRQKALAGLSLITIIFAALGIVSTLKQKNKAVLEAEKANQVTEFLINSLEQNDPDITKGKDLSVKELLYNAKTQINESALEEVALKAQLKATIGTALAKVGDYEESIELLKDSIIEDENIANKLSLVKVLLLQKEFDFAEFHLKTIEKSLDKISNYEQITFNQMKAELHLQRGDFDAAMSSINKALSLSTNQQSRSYIQSQLILAKIYNDNNQQNKQLEILENALTISDKLYSPKSTSSTQLSLLLADAYTNTDPTPWDKAEQYYNEALTNQIEIYNKNHPVVGKTRLRFGFLYRTMGDLEKAKEHALEAKRIALLNFDETHIFSAHVDSLLSQIAVFSGEIDQAIKLLEASLNVYSSYYGENHFETNQIKTSLVAYYLRQNQNKKALEILKPLYESQKQQLGEENRATLYVVLNKLKALNQLEQFDQAIHEGEPALKLSKEHLGESFTITIGIQLALSESYFETKDYTRSIELARPLLDIDFVKNYPLYDKKVSNHLIKSYLKEQQTENAILLKQKLIEKYYVSNEDKRSPEYQSLLKLFEGL